MIYSDVSLCQLYFSFSFERNDNYEKLYGTYLCQGSEINQQVTNYVGGTNDFKLCIIAVD